MTTVSIGLTFPGTCEQAFNLYKSTFGGEFIDFIRYRDDTFTDAGTPLKDKAKIAYVTMKLGGVFITGDDTLESAGTVITPGNNMGINYGPDTKEEADKVFQILADAGKVISPNTVYPWGYCGSLIDRFGVRWNFFVPAPRK
jgi:PhnB protein